MKVEDAIKAFDVSVEVYEENMRKKAGCDPEALKIVDVVGIAFCVLKSGFVTALTEMSDKEK